LIAAEAPFDGRNVWRHPILAELAVDDTTLAIVDSLMGTQNYIWHHVHAARHDAGLRGIARMHGRTGSLELDLPPADSSASRPVAGAIPIVQ